MVPVIVNEGEQRCLTLGGILPCSHGNMIVEDQHCRMMVTEIGHIDADLIAFAVGQS